ncbi:MAG TPA: HNH endonuclease signature motif containing protein [Patescibacteria group bacterium]|nr:HNH endonuclease signature motif containing protein [Patescibacteria group bacterium]
MKRSSIPKELEREVLVEAGHRCAIPTCQRTPVEIAHIDPWFKVKEHRFENLIALCPNCHDRYDKKHEIDRKSMLRYKANLSVINNRYGDLEKRILTLFAESPNDEFVWVVGGLDILLMYLLRDGLLVPSGKDSGVILSGIPSAKEYRLTTKGRGFVNNWVSPRKLS